MNNTGEHFANRIEHIQKVSGNVNRHSGNFERFLETPVDNPSLKVGQWIDRFISIRASNGCSEHTIRKYRWCLQLLLEHLETRGGIDIVSGIEDWAKTLHQTKQGIKVKTRKTITIASMLGEIATFARWLLDNELIDRKPQIRFKRPPTNPKALSTEQIHRAVTFFDEETAFLIKFVSCTALRIETVLSLTREDFDMDTLTVTVYSKGNKLQKAAVAECLHDECRRRLEALGLNEKLFPLARRTYYNRIHDKWSKLGFRLNFHMLRHTFARHFCMNGGGVPALQAILGHSTPDMSLHYARVFSDDALRLQREINPIDAMAKGK